MQFTLATVMAVAAMLPSAFAHYNFDKLIVDGKATAEYEYVRKSTNYNSPVTDVTSKDFTCNVGTQAAAANTKTHKVTAGSTLGFTATTIGHPGPLNVYMSKAPGAASAYDGSGDWFRIYEAGVKKYATDSTGVEWVTDGALQVSFPIPKNIADGEYLLRVEHIGLHGAGSFGGAQFYISCAQIEVTGGAGGSPSPMVKIPGVYDGKEPGILMQLYYPPVKSYTIPGPAIYGSSAGGAPAPVPAPGPVTSRPAAIPTSTASAVPATSAVATSAPAPVSSGFATVVRPTTTSAPAPAPVCPGASATPTVADAVGAPGGGAKYAQCGGKDFKGVQGCASGLTCKVMNPYYSQCL